MFYKRFSIYMKFISLFLFVSLFMVIQPTSAQDQLVPTVEFTLTTRLGGDPAMSFVGVGGDIDGVVNPELRVNVGDVVQLTLINADPVMHDLTLNLAGADGNLLTTGNVLTTGETASLTFLADTAGVYMYYCAQPGHQITGMQGSIIVADPSETSNAPDQEAISIIRNPIDVPAPIGNRDATTVQIELNTVELEGQLADGTIYTYWTFEGQVPGPMLRVRVGDTIEMTIHNMPDSMNAHSIDLHAVTGPGGGAVYTQSTPGESTTFSFRALQPGLFVYHCATPSVGTHIANGMYGMILVEPEGGLPPVDREFYVMQGEIYTQQPYGSAGHLTYDYDAMLSETPDYYVFNGAANALTLDDYALRANVGETVRVFFGVGGPNKISSFHIIGEILDRVYDQASLTAAPLTDVQTTIVPPGGATMIELTLDYPGRYLLVDHAISRLERGLLGFLYVEGEADPTIFDAPGLTSNAGQ